MDYKMLTLKISDDAHRKIKMLASYEGVAIIHLVEQMIEDRFIISKLPPPKKPPKPPEQLSIPE